MVPAYRQIRQRPPSARGGRPRATEVSWGARTIETAVVSGSVGTAIGASTVAAVGASVRVSTGTSVGIATVSAISPSALRGAFTVEVQLTPGVWTAIDADIHAPSGLRFRYGIEGNGPADCVASTGELSFTLRNDAGNSGGIQGWYSPRHASKRAGWNYGIPIRLRFTAPVAVTKFRGKIRQITPTPGQYRSQRVHVVAYDPMRDLMEAEVRNVTLQVNKNEAELLNAILDALPVDAQPPAREIGGVGQVGAKKGIDLIPWAFDNVGPGMQAAALLRDVTLSSLGLLFSDGAGTLKYINRGYRTTAARLAYGSFFNTMHGLTVPSTLDKVYNRIRVTIHPKHISTAATDVLYELATDSSIEIRTGQSTVLWVDYTDPDNREAYVGGLNVVTPLVGGTHYIANSAEDGTGTNLTASITASISAFASTAKITLTNNSSSTAYIRTLKVIGRAVRDPGPQTLEAYTPETYGDRPFTLDMPYQNDHHVAQSAATYLSDQYDGAIERVDSMEFLASESDYLMRAALLNEPSSRITINETVTGTSVDSILHSVDMWITPGPMIRVRWGLAPASPYEVWQLGTAGYSELGSTTRLGF